MSSRSFKSVSFEDYEDFSKVFDSVSSPEELHAYHVFRQTRDYYDSINEKREEVISEIIDEINSLIQQDNDPRFKFLESLLKQLDYVENNSRG